MFIEEKEANDSCEYFASHDSGGSLNSNAIVIETSTQQKENVFVLQM